jgi:hypothetical protein
MTGKAARPASLIVDPLDALDICGGIVEALRESGAMPDDCALCYSSLGLLRYLREKLPPGAAASGAERWRRLETPLKIDYTLSDRARYEPRIARAAGVLREGLRGLVIGDKRLAFSVANLLRQSAVDAGVMTENSPAHRAALALLDFIETDGTGGDPARPRYADGGRVPEKSTFEVKISRQGDIR